MWQYIVSHDIQQERYIWTKVLNQNERTNRSFLHLYFLLPNTKASTGTALPLLPNIMTRINQIFSTKSICYQERVFDQSMSKYEMMYLTGNGTVHIIRKVNFGNYNYYFNYLAYKTVPATVQYAFKLN
jgi:hypothetical protein